MAAVYTAGGSVAVSAVKKGAKEIGEEVVEQAVKKSADDLLEAGAKKTTKEVLEQLAKKEGGDIAAVVTKNADELAEEAAKKADEIIDLTPGSKGGWNKALNATLKPNSKYKVGNKIYETDNLGRVKKVSGDLELGKLGRNNYQQGKSVTLKDGTKGVDQGGHLVGHQFKGAGEQINYVPMKGSLNQGAWKQMEETWAKALKEVPPKAVNVDIRPIYNGISKKPTTFKVVYKIDGKKYIKTFPNN